MNDLDTSSTRAARVSRPKSWRWIPALLRPRVIVAVRSLRSSVGSPFQLIRSALVLTLAVLLWTGLYESAERATHALMKRARFDFQPVELLLQAVLSGIVVLLFFSCAVTALAVLFLGKDLERLRAAPISQARFITAKLAESILYAAWVPLFLATPFLGGMLRTMQASWTAWLVSIVAVVALFLIPSTLAMFVVQIVARYFPANRAREFVVMVGLVLIVGGYLAIHAIVPKEVATQDLGVVLGRLTGRMNPLPGWTPGALCARASLAAVSADWNAALVALATLLLEAALALALVLVTAGRFYAEAFSRAASVRRIGAPSFRPLRRAAGTVWFWMKPHERALIGKDYRIFARDMLQALQLLVLIGLCAVYLYNFQILRMVGERAQFTPEVRLWWHSILVFLNLIVGTLVIAAVGMRFVYPSVSLEGQNFWIIQAAPVSAESFLKAKFWSWLLPIACIASVILVSGALAVQAEPRIVLVSGAAAWVFCYGIVGLGVGLGAQHANFQWDHPGQVIASTGSLLYLLVSSLLVMLGALPVGTLIALRTLRSSGYMFTQVQWYACVFLAAGALVMLNYLAARWAISAGAEALEKGKV